MKNAFTRFVFFLDRHRIVMYLGTFLVVLGLLSWRILPLIRMGAFESAADMWAGIAIGLVALPLIGIFACKVVLDMLTEAIVKPKVQAASEREKPKRLQASQVSDPRFEAAFAPDEVEQKYSKAKFRQINEDKMGLLGRWKLYWRAKMVLRRKRKK